MKDLAAVSAMLGMCAGLMVWLALYPRHNRLAVNRKASHFPCVVLARFAAGVTRRRTDEQAVAQWPALLEGMAVAVSAGMDILRAFEICASKTYGPLRHSLDKVVVRLRSGMSLPAALAVMEKEGFSGARRLRATLAQAEALGVPVANMLEALAAEYYTMEKQRFEAKITSLPVKLSAVTVGFLLPPVLIISVMPHVMSFLGAGW